MTSIPFDPTLNLGQIVNPQKIKNLLEIAEIQKGLKTATDKMNNLIRMCYKLRMILSEMRSMGVSEKNLKKIQKKLDKTKSASIDAAIAYADAAVKCEEDLIKAKQKQGQTTISKTPESPLDYGQCEVSTFPLSFDSLKFDVQYLRNESNKDSTYSHALAVQATASQQTEVSDGIRGTKATTSMSASMNASLEGQCSQHNIEGTIIITATATHKNAAIIDPFVIDPDKAVNSWNQCHPEDRIDVDPVNIMNAALSGMKKPMHEQNVIQILSGCSKSSSFVGYVHILQQEYSKSTQAAMTMAADMRSSVEASVAVAGVGGGYGSSMNMSSTVKSLTSTAHVENHANLSSIGCIPNIVSEDVTTTLQSLKPDPQEVMGNLASMSAASSGATSQNMEACVGDVKSGTQFTTLSGDFLQNSVSAVGELSNTVNKVIDTNSMMTAFEDFVSKAMAGEGGVPTNFYMKRLTKADIAKCYIRRYYPNGADDPEKAQKGMLGQTSQDS